MEVGYIYVMRMDDYYKIGKTKNKKRLGEYTKLPKQPEYLVISKVLNFHELERQLHSKYINKRTRKNCEWYSLSENDINEIRIFLKEYEINDNHNKQEKSFYKISFDYDKGLSIDKLDFYTSLCQRKLHTDEYHCPHCGGNNLYLKFREKKNGPDILRCKRCDRFVRFANDEIRKYYIPDYCGEYKYENGAIETYKYYTVKGGFNGCYSNIYFEDSDVNIVNKTGDMYIGYGDDIEAMILKIISFISIKIDETYNTIKDCRTDIEIMNNCSKQLIEYINDKSA